MGPPRERDGERWELAQAVARHLDASMGPPRERDGELQKTAFSSSAKSRLQWGRRVNATESITFTQSACGTSGSSLQWGRRVNATESH